LSVRLYEDATIVEEYAAHRARRATRAALGAATLPFPMRRFRMFLDWPGKKDQARSITTVTEDIIS